MIGWILALVLGGGGLTLSYSGWAKRRSAASVARSVEATLPDVTDLMVVVLGAGGTIANAVRVVAERGPPSAGLAFEAVLARCAAGHTMAFSLAGVSEDLGSAYRPLMAALIATERDGAPVASLVLRLGDEARAARGRQAERRARSLPVQLLFPLVCCSLPAVFVGAVLPLILMSLGRLRL